MKEDEIRGYNYNCTVTVVARCKETGKTTECEIPVIYYAGTVEPDKRKLVSKVLRQALVK